MLKWFVFTVCFAIVFSEDNAVEGDVRVADIESAELEVLKDRIIDLIVRLQNENHISEEELLPVTLESAEVKGSALVATVTAKILAGVQRRRCRVEFIGRQYLPELQLVTCGEQQWELE